MRLPSIPRQFAAPMLSLGLVVGLWADAQLFHQPVGDAGEYHARLRALADRIPYRIGEWVGTDVPPPAAAVSLLKPNFLLGREFLRPSTGERATLVMVQCRDARDMTGHWPPICYPAQGWTQRDAQTREIAVREGTVPVTVYRFTIESIDRYSELFVYNFFARPDGVLENGRGAIVAAAGNPRMKVFGAAQVQVVFRSSIPADRRDAVFAELVEVVAPILDSVRAGVTR